MATNSTTSSASLPAFYSLLAAPTCLATERMLLKRLFRLKRAAKPKARVAFVFDHPRRARPGCTTLPPEQCADLRERLSQGPPDPDDLKLITELQAAGQAVFSLLFDCSDAERITSLGEVEARKLLDLMLFDGSHPEDYIIEATWEGQRQRRTWRWGRSSPDLLKHLRGERICGPKRGKLGRLITVDLDRHCGDVAADYHSSLVIEVGTVLSLHHPRMRFAPEVNLKNASVKFFGWAEVQMPIKDAVLLAEAVRATLARELPRHDWAKVEIYPSNSPQVYAPLRPDKAMIIGSGRVGMVNCRRYQVVSGKRRLVPSKILSPAQYLNWVFFETTPPDASALAAALQTGLMSCPDLPPSEKGAERKVQAKASGTRTASASRSGGSGDIGPLKGRTSRVLTGFWGGKLTPPPDTVNKLIVVTLRVLRGEGLALEEALGWLECRLSALGDTSFSDRLTNDRPELMRMTRAVAGRVWQDNGYQPDADASDKIIFDVVSAWAARGFRLHDPSTWGAVEATQHFAVDEHPLSLVWTPRLKGLLPTLAVLAKTDVDKAKTFMETVLVFVARHSELAEAKVGSLLAKCGIKGKSKGKQHKVCKFFEDEKIIVLHKSYVHDKASGMRHGNFYFLGPDVRFNEDVPAPAPSPPHTPVSIYYLPFSCDSDETEYRQEARRLACERKFRARRRHRRQKDANNGSHETGGLDIDQFLREAFVECFQ